MRAGVKRELGWMLTGVGAAAILAGRKRLAASAAGGAALLLALAALRKRESFRGQSALVTGGSRGLGLAIATELARRGAKVAILARDGAELARARERIREEVAGAEVVPLVCDVTDREALAAAIFETAARQGGIDLLVNNAGSITVGPFESMERVDFDAQLELHLHAVREACLHALPFLRVSPHRRIVNICSMGGKAGVPHMLAYDTSKFALAGFAQGLTAELAPEGISVTTVFPAVMRTGSPIQAVFKGDHEREFAWFQASDVFPLVSLSADAAARKLLDAALRRDTELVPSLAGRLRNLAAALFPETVTAAMGLAAGMLPAGQSKEPRTGAESRARFDRSFLLAPLRPLARRAERRWNQEPKGNARYQMGRRDGRRAAR